MNTRLLACSLVLLSFGFSGDHRARASMGGATQAEGVFASFSLAADPKAAPTKNDWSRSSLYAGRGENKTAGAGAGTKSAVLAGLGWLRRHESSDGGWSSAG